MDAIGVGIIGGGFMADVHSRAVRSVGGSVVAVTSSTPGKSRDAAARIGARRSHATVDDLLADDEVELVHIVTPNATHHDLAMRAISAGKHVVCEKPLATSSSDADALVRAANRAHIVATVPFVYRFHPMAREMRARASRSAGRLLSVQGAYLQDWLLNADDDNWRVDAALGGPSRAFADIGSHLCDLVEFATNERLARVQAMKRTVHADRQGNRVTTEDMAGVLGETEGGAIVSLLVSQMAAGRKNALTIEIHGSDESLRFEQEDPERLWIGRRERSEWQLRNNSELSLSAKRLAFLPPGHPQGYQDAFAGFVADTFTAMKGDAPEGLPTFADGARAVRLTEAVMASSESGRWTSVDQPNLEETQ